MVLSYGISDLLPHLKKKKKKKKSKEKFERFKWRHTHVFIHW